MKEFVKWTLAVMCGIFIMGIIGFFLTLGFIGSLAAVGETTPVIPREGVLKIDMSSFVIGEQTTENDLPGMSALGNGSVPTIGIWDAVQAVNAAATDPGVQFIYLKTDGNLTPLSQLEEFRVALQNFRDSGKAIVAYGESMTVGNYYLASVADKLYLSGYAGSESMMTGVGSQMIFVKDLLDKLGVNMQLIRHGKYKSAGEMFIKNAPSAENLEQNQAMINSIWKTVSTQIADAKGITTEQLTEWIDNLELGTAQDFISKGLADSAMTREGLRNQIALLCGKDSFDKVMMIQFTDYSKIQSMKANKGEQKIAIIYADGEIVEGDENQEIAGDRFAKVIAGVRADSTVKAVVLRVSSPGGSVSASDKIKTELDLLKKDKPLIASYGAYAASGGYWISNNCDYIFSDATTLTGSIGVYSMIPDFSKTAKNLAHVNILTVGSSKHSDMLTGMRPLDAQEVDYMQKSVNNIYDRFVGTVCEGRGMEPDFVDSIAQGRVWTGEDALGIGLVDQIGTLEDAVNYACSLVSGGVCTLSDWNIAAYPAMPTVFESLMAMFGSTTTPDNDVLIKGTPFESFARTIRKWDPNTSDRYMARMPYFVEIR